MMILRRASLIFTGCLLPWLSGCGSGNQATHVTPAASTGRGAVQIAIHWPTAPKNRLIPAASQYIEIQITDAEGTFFGSGSAARPFAGDSSTITIDGVENGVYTETATAYANTQAGGPPMAVGSQQITVLANTVNKTADLVMNSTITSIVITPGNPTAAAGGSPITLAASAKDKTGNLILTVPGNFKWTLQPTTAASLTPTGSTAVLQGLAGGTVIVGVQESESGISSTNVSVPITGVTPPTTGTITFSNPSGTNANTTNITAAETGFSSMASQQVYVLQEPGSHAVSRVLNIFLGIKNTDTIAVGTVFPLTSVQPLAAGSARMFYNELTMGSQKFWNAQSGSVVVVAHDSQTTTLEVRDATMTAPDLAGTAEKPMGTFTINASGKF